ncbi:MAG: patatin-like phospholipase family protein [Hyphomicrobiaceae bacterium]
MSDDGGDKWILSLDGGGVRGLMVAVFLGHLEREVGRPLATCFDLIAGTSSGALLTGGLSLGPDGNALVPTSELTRFFYEDGPRIFRSSRMGFFKTWRWLRGPLYSTPTLNRLLEQRLGPIKLSDVTNNILLTAYDMRRGEPVLFQSWLAGSGRAQAMRDSGRGALQFCPTRDDEATQDFALAEAITASAAVPTFFAPINVPRRGGEYYALIDGFVFAINPVMPAYFAARLRFGFENRFRILSIGTGKNERKYDIDDLAGRGAIGWVRPVLEAFPDGASDASVTYMDWLSGITDVEHHRINAIIDQAVDKDAPSPDFDDASRTNLERLEAFGHQLFERNRERLDPLIQDLRAHAESIHAPTS